MLDRTVRWLYHRLSSRYWLVLMAGEAAVSVLVALLTVVILASYYDATWAAVAVLAVTVTVLTVLAVLGAALRGKPLFDRVLDWRAAPDPGAEETVAAWDAATTLTFRQFRRDTWWINLLIVVPSCVVAVHALDLPWTGFFVVLLAGLVPAAYATVLSYAVGEVLSRPLVAEVAAELPDEFRFERHGLPVDKRLKLGIPTYTATAGLVVAAVVGGRDGSDQLVLAVLAALSVGLVLSHELSVLLARGITRPIAEVRSALARVRRGDLTARVPVTTSDELGELAHDFNLMARGLAEREQMRAAFGTYMDKEVAQLILSGQFPESGVEVDVSILFCDVRGFTAFAEGAPAPEVIATLNRLFEAVVPVVERYGGHVDKFTGDGLIAVFGAPEAYPDHADRAVRAACDLVSAVAAGGTGLRVAAGVNTGRVVAGSVGGGGRLNFSVIGDAVNVAARVEAATRDTGDDVLITATTHRRLLARRGWESRGSIPLKGKAAPVEVYAPSQASAGALTGPEDAVRPLGG